MEQKKEGRRSVSPHRVHIISGPRAQLIGPQGQIPGNILSTILRSPHPNLQPGQQRNLTEVGRGQSPIRVLTTLPPSSVTSSVSPRAGLSPSRTPTTLPPKKSISPSRSVYSGSRTPSPKPVKSGDLGQGSQQGQSQGRQGQGQLLSHLPYLAQTLQGSIAPEGLFQQYKVQQIPVPSSHTTAGPVKEVGPPVISVGRRSPGRQTQPLPAHQRIPTPPTVRRTPSPAHMPLGADQTAKVIVAHTGGNRPQAVNLVKVSAHQAMPEHREVDADFKYGDLLQSINRSHENIQSHLLQGGLSPITPADPINGRPWSSQPAPQLVPVPSVAMSLGHALSSGTFSQSQSVQPPASRSPGTVLGAHTSVSPAVGFTPVALPSQSYQSAKAPDRVYSIPVPTSSTNPIVSTSNHLSGSSFIHPLGTSAQSVSMTEPGPPNITISSCTTIPTQDRPLQKLPRNPFTFPATPPVTLANERPAIGLSSPVVQSKLKTDGKSIANEKKRHGSDEMPQLSPVKKVEIKNEDEKDLVLIPNAYNMRLQTLANIPNNPTYRPTYRATSVAIHKAKVGCVTNSAKSMDLLRQNLQKSMNKEIDAVIQSYMEKFFKLGIENIRLNNGENSITDDHIQAVCRQILEEAKKMYISETGRQSVSPARELSDNVSETGSSGRRSALGRRRHPSDTDSEASLRPTGNATKKKKGRYIVNLTGRSTPSKLAAQQCKREGPKFEPERLNEETLFVMGSKANKAMGFGATRGRLYMKHPELFKYSGDQDDKTWLYEHQHMPATGGKSYLIVLNDVRELALNDEYRDASGITVESLSGFAVPIWMIEKMRIQMVAMRTDLPKQTKYRSRSTTPNEASLAPEEINDNESPPKEIKDLPFASFSSPKQNTDLDVLAASTTDEDLEFLSNTGNSNTPSQMSPFNMTGGFDDTASQSDLDTLDEDSGLRLLK